MTKAKKQDAREMELQFQILLESPGLKPQAQNFNQIVINYNFISKLRSHKEVNEIETPGNLTLHLTIKVTSNTPKRNNNNDVQPQISSSEARSGGANHVAKAR